MKSRSEYQFIQRFQTIRIHRGSPMSQGMFEEMVTNDLKALNDYLSPSEPVNNIIENITIAP